MNQQSNLTEQSLNIANYIYSILPDFPDDETWNTVSKLRTSVNELAFYCAEADGNPDIAASHFEWSRACRSVAGLIILCRLSIKQKFVEIDSTIMVNLEKLSNAMQKKYEVSKQQDDNRDQKSMENWLKRYKIWKETEL